MNCSELIYLIYFLYHGTLTYDYNKKVFINGYQLSI